MIHSYGDRHLQTSAGFFISIRQGVLREVLHRIPRGEFPCLLGILYVSVTSFVEGSVVRVVFGINGCAGFRILVEDILAWVDLVIYDYLVCLPAISH